MSQFQPPYPPTPDMYQLPQPSLPPAPPRKRLRRTDKIALAIIAAIVVIVGSLVLYGISVAYTPDTSALSQADLDSTATASDGLTQTAITNQNATEIAASNLALSNDLTQAALTPTAPPPTVTQPTPTATSQPTQTQIPSTGDLNTLISSKDGKVTDVSAPTTNDDGTSNIALDVQVNAPTQTRIKHLCFELMQFFFQRSDVKLTNISFHANGYTGMDDPIASCAGLAPANWLSMDETQIWNALGGIFDVDLPA